MFGNIEQYFEENVLREYLEYVRLRKNNKIGFSKDMRQGLKSAHCLYHFREHFPAELNITRGELIEICPNYNLLSDTVNVSKHGKIDRNNPRITDARNIREQIFNTTYKDKKGEYQYIQKEIVIKLDSGEEIVLYELLTEILNMWLRLLKKRGFFKETPYYKSKPARLPRRNKKSGVLDIETGPMFYGMSHRMLRYNYDTRVAEPMDLTGAKIEMRIYAHPVTLTIEHPKLKEPKSIELLLDEKQMKRINSLNEQNAIFELLKIADSKGLVKLLRKSEK